MSATQSELRLARLIDERELIRNKHESKLAEIESREDKTLTESDREQLTMYREQSANIDTEVTDLAAEIDANNKAIEESKRLRRMKAGEMGVEIDEDGGTVYRTMFEYARDVILTADTPRCRQIATQFGDRDEIQRARERLQLQEQLLKRTPANTLSSDVTGLTPAQHIAQIFQIIDKSRPIVESARRATLVRGKLTYPEVVSTPVVAAQATEKTEAGNTKLQVDMVEATATVYLGGGDLSWQAINWSTPAALQLWFDEAAAHYALKTEQDAAQVISHSAFTHAISSPLAGTPTFAQFMTAVGAGGSKVFADSARMANTVYMAPDRYWYLFGTTSDAAAQFTTVSGSGVGPLKFVSSRGLDSGVVIVGDSNGLLVAETAGAPVELQVTEPAIAGVEVGIVGGFEAVVVDDGAFAMITTAS